MASTIKLSDKRCVPCEGGAPILSLQKIEELQKQLAKSWEVSSNKSIKREFKFKTFKQAISFVNRIAEVAEEQGHHPNIEIKYNKVMIVLTTHAIGGLSENDFIIASKIEQL